MNAMDVNPPFTDQEKRFVLAEAIKNSNVPVERLLLVFYEANIQPDWPQMLLPHGRNMQSCINTFRQLQPSQSPSQPPSQPPFPPTFHTQSYQVPPPPPKATPMKRKPPPENLETAAGHDPKRRLSDINQHTSIAPKPSNVSPTSNAHGKKRGRPSKAAVAQRDAEAIARGEVIAPPRTSSLRADTPVRVERMSAPVYANIAPMRSPRPMGSPITPSMYDSPTFSSSDNSGMRRQRPPARTMANPGESSFPVASPRMGERSTYPSIISSLNDTIPSSHGGDYSPYRAPLPLPPQTTLPPSSLPPPILPPSILPPPPSLPPSSQPPPPPRSEP